MGCTMYGDWAKAGVVLKRLAVSLNPFAKGMLYEDGQLQAVVLKDTLLQ